MAQNPTFGLIQIVTVDPTAGAGVAGLPYEFLFRTTTGVVYIKTGTANTAWTPLGTGAGGQQAFTYTATGAEANPFTVNLPATRIDTNYMVMLTMAGPAANAIKSARPLASSYTTTQFQVELGGAIQANDVFQFLVVQKT